MIPDWAKELNCSITVCDKNGIIIYQNDPVIRRVLDQMIHGFGDGVDYTDIANLLKHGGLIGKNMFDCHNERSRAIINHLLETGGTNVYTIEKRGVHKVIYQSAWKENGEVKGLCEISMITPADMPHYVRE